MRLDGRRILVVALLTLYLVLAITSMLDDSPTVDEFVYPVEGQYYVLTGDFTFNPENPPLAKLIGGLPLLWHEARLNLDPRWRTRAGGWEPWLLGTRFMFDNMERYHQMFVEARIFPILLGALLGWFVFLWSRELWGNAGGLLSLALYVLCPNVLAHARLITPDLPVTCFMFLASYFLWRAMTTGSRRSLVLVGVATGLALASKLSALLLFPILILQSLLIYRGRKPTEIRPNRGCSLGGALSIVAIAIAVLGAAFAFRGLMLRMDALPFASDPLRAVRAAMPWLRLPVPEGFLLGIDAKAVDATTGEFPGFMFGKWASSGWHSFYVMSLLTKTPIATLLLLAAALAGWNLETARKHWLGAAVTALPVITFMILSTLFFYRINYGLRYLLPIFPFIHVLCGRAAVLGMARPNLRVLVAALALWSGLSSLSAYPHYLAYFNESVGGPENGYHCFVDSNVDWGQDLKRLKRWMDETDTDRIHLAYFGHVSPEVYGISFEPLLGGTKPKGTIAISASLLQGLPYTIMYEEIGRFRRIRPDDFAWLRDLTPVASIGHSILLFQSETN